MTDAARTRASVRAILAARRGRGFRSTWLIPERHNAVQYVPAGRSAYGSGAWVHFPHVRPSDGEEVRAGACLIRHRAMVKNELRKLAAWCAHHNREASR